MRALAPTGTVAAARRCCCYSCSCYSCGCCGSCCRAATFVIDVGGIVIFYAIVPAAAAVAFAAAVVAAAAGIAIFPIYCNYFFIISTFLLFLNRFLRMFANCAPNYARVVLITGNTARPLVLPRDLQGRSR